MLVKKFKGGYDRNFCYVISENKQAVIIDPFKDDELINYIKKLEIQYLISTHSHHDHVEYNEEVKEKTGAIIVLHESTKHYADKKVKDSEELSCGNLKIKLIHTPGHIQDGMCILIEDRLFTGDLLFVGKIGGTGINFPGSDAKQEWESLQKIMRLDDSIIVYPGHDYGKTPDSTIGKEKKSNPFINCGNFEKFVWIKENWHEYKKEHNLV